MSQALLPLKDGPWTIEDLAMLPEDERRYEIVDGQLVMVPSPSLGHQSVVGKLRELIAPRLGDTMLSFEGVALDLHPSYRIPDLTVFSTAGFDPKAIKLHPRHVVLVVEVVSPGSRTNDRITKPAQVCSCWHTCLLAHRNRRPRQSHRLRIAWRNIRGTRHLDRGRDRRAHRTVCSLHRDRRPREAQLGQLPASTASLSISP